MTARPQGWAHERQSLQGKKILISGGTTGIGRATARLLAAEGADVLIYGREQQPLDDAIRDIKPTAKGKVHGLTADQSRPEDVQRVFQAVDSELGGIDVLINNAAIGAEDVVSMDDDDIVYAVQSNLTGYLLCARHALKRMQKQGAGHILNVGSLSAEVREKGSGVYVATKSAIQAWSEAMRKVVNKKGVHVSLLELGSVGTDMQGPPGAQRKKEAKGEMLTAEDVAEAVLYCLTQPARCDIINIRMRPHLQTI